MSTDLVEADKRDIDQARNMTVSEMKLIITKMFVAVDKAETKIELARIEIGHWLLKLRQQIESGEEGDLCAIDWWGWYADNFPQSRSYAEKYMRIAVTENPPLAYQKEKDRNAERVRAFRARQKQLTAPRETPVLGSGSRVLSASAEAEEALPQRRNRR